MKNLVTLFFVLFCIAFWQFSIAQNPCETKDIILEIESELQGNYRTSANIKCASKAVDHTKLMAGKEVILQAGFSLSQNLNLELNNEGCDLYTDKWDIVNLDIDKLRKIYLPSTYPNAGVKTGRDTWFFTAYRSDDQVNFNFEIGPGNPYMPTTLTEPLLQTYKNYNQKQLIYSTFENGKLNGVFYYGNSGFDFRDTGGVYLHFTGTGFEEILFVDYNKTEHEEIIAILESISPCVLTSRATIMYTGPLFVDGCEYIITINDEDYKAINQDEIDDAFFQNIREPVTVTITYRNIPGLIRPCFAPTYFKQLSIVDIDYLN